MFPAALNERVDALIDDLILDGGVEAASIASILLAAQDSVTRNDLVSLSRRVWVANNDLLAAHARKQHAVAPAVRHWSPTG